MRGARERNVLRWDAQRAQLDAEIARIEQELAQEGEAGAGAADSPGVLALRRQLEEALRKRQALGPSPRPKMG